MSTSDAPHLEDTAVPIIVQSHLRWDFVWQRPQQLLSRLSARHRVLFIEEPMFVEDTAAARLTLERPLPEVYRALPLLPARLRDRYDESIATIRDLVRDQMKPGGTLSGLFERPIHWFYTPMPAPAMIGAFDERAIVYDCMDELSKFRFAPTALVDRERLLMASADVVFTGGHRLWQSKSRHHANVHFFGCGVDIPHFARARAHDLPVPNEIASLGKRVMGYYGVIDERIDYALLAELAARHENDALVMVGPVVKVDPSELPQAPNIHWLGQRSYDELPALVKGFDVCLMPFALNEATEYINPTKTLEYMAAGKPIVSTALSDVKHHFVPVVAVADTHEEFVNLVGRALDAPDAKMIARGLEEVQTNSWDSVVSRMERVLTGSLRGREERPSRVARSDASRASSADLIQAADGVGD